MPSTFKPYDLATIKLPVSTRRRVVEIISRPIPGGCKVKALETIMVRMVPGCPDTLNEVETKDLVAITNPERYVHIGKVRYSFTFPEDMLRYEGASLYDHTLSEDEIPKTIQEVVVYRMSRVKIGAVAGGKGNWVQARWNSFSAGVEHLHTVDRRDRS